ncbi:TerC family protein [Massilibacterium senegalense]|uniref:TerC family protein n=1 Tax=Massilibacterium senegalense TaxID=1632858 RepID=UPI000782FE81|nr:TerC family protein [Massilibacterium senegalense]
MELSLFLEYGWVFLILVALEGILAADNALVMAMMVRHLPPKERKKALFYGLAGAFIFRIGSLFIISLLVDVWQVQAIGAIYLIFLSLNHLVKKFVLKKQAHQEVKPSKGSGFWMTVLKVEVADIAFAIDSILAAVALAITLPKTSLPSIGGMDGAQFIVVFLGGFIGVILIRFAATFFVNLLNRKPGLETVAYLIVGWVGVKLLVITLAHPEIAMLHVHFPHSAIWKIIFWGVLIGMAVFGWLFSKEQKEVQDN